LTQESKILDREVMYPYKGVGGLHQVVSEPDIEFVCRQQTKEKGDKLISFVVSKI
jgi:hypothetical protein